MTNPLLAEFSNPALLCDTASRVQSAKHRIIDAFSPYPLEGLESTIGIYPSRIRHIMLAGGLAIATVAYALQWYSSVIGYPINSGDRPLNSWQVFLLVPFEIGIFSAALCGVVSFFYYCRLPQLHHPLFGVPGFERSTQDRFFLLVQPRDENAVHDLRRIMESSGALVTEMRPS